MTGNPFACSEEAVEDAIQRLRAIGVRSVQKKTSFQIKVGPFNFYPARGTIIHDRDQKARQDRGLDAFIALLRKSGLVPRPGSIPPAVRLVLPDDED